MKKFTLPKDGGLIEEGLPLGIKHTYERIPVHVFEDEDDASERLAEKIVAAINGADGVFKLGFLRLHIAHLLLKLRDLRRCFFNILFEFFNFWVQ